mgnify:CR=1 FL=1
MNFITRSNYCNLSSARFLSWDDLLAVLLLVQSVIGLGVAYA